MVSHIPSFEETKITNIQSLLSWSLCSTIVQKKKKKNQSVTKAISGHGT
jgi:hypothetical protein